MKATKLHIENFNIPCQTDDHSDVNLANLFHRDTLELRSEFIEMMQLIKSLSEGAMFPDTTITALSAKLYEQVREQADPASLSDFIKIKTGGYTYGAAEPINPKSNLTRALIVLIGRAENFEELKAVYETYNDEKRKIQAKDLSRHLDIIKIIKEGREFVLSEILSAMGVRLDSAAELTNIDKIVSCLASRDTTEIDAKIQAIDLQIRAGVSREGDSSEGLIQVLVKLKDLRVNMPLIVDEVEARNVLSLMNQRDLYGQGYTAIAAHLRNTSQPIVSGTPMFAKGVMLVPAAKLAEDRIYIAAGHIISCEIKRPKFLMEMSGEATVVLDIINSVQFNPGGIPARYMTKIESARSFNVPLEIMPYISRETSDVEKAAEMDIKERFKSPAPARSSPLFAIASTVSEVASSLWGSVSSGFGGWGRSAVVETPEKKLPIALPASAEARLDTRPQTTASAQSAQRSSPVLSSPDSSLISTSPDRVEFEDADLPKPKRAITPVEGVVKSKSETPNI